MSIESAQAQHDRQTGSPTTRSELEACADRLDDIASTIGHLRKAVADRGRIDCQVWTAQARKRIAAARLDEMDSEAMGLIVNAIDQQIQYGGGNYLPSQLRGLLLPMVSCLESILEEIEGRV